MKKSKAVCTDCGGSGRDSFTMGGFWCGGCGGTGLLSDQKRRAREMEEIKARLESRWEKLGAKK